MSYPESKLTGLIGFAQAAKPSGGRSVALTTWKYVYNNYVNNFHFGFALAQNAGARPWRWCSVVDELAFY